MTFLHLLQDNVKRIALGASSATNKAVYTTTTPSRNVLADKPRAVDISIISDIHKDILRRRVNSYGEDPLESSTNPSNSMSVSVEPAMGSTETANPSTLSAASTSAAMDPITPTSRSQSRSNSLSMKTAGVAVVASNPFNVSTESKTETSSSSSAAATSSQYQVTPYRFLAPSSTAYLIINDIRAIGFEQTDPWTDRPRKEVAVRSIAASQEQPSGNRQCDEFYGC